MIHAITNLPAQGMNAADHLPQILILVQVHSLYKISDIKKILSLGLVDFLSVTP